MTHYGYWALFVALALESLALPVFSEIVLAYAGYLVGIGALSLWGATGSALAGSLVGAAIAYQIGRRGGRALLHGRLSRWIPRERIDHYEARLHRSMWLALFAGRILSGVRSVSSYLGGVFRLPFLPFMLYSALGALVWTMGIVLAGMFLGERWDDLVRALHSFGLVATLVLLAGGILLFAARRSRRAAR